MNHDYAHCLDYTDDCPKECFRGELVRDLKEIPYPLPVSWMHLKDTEECRREKHELKPCPFCGRSHGLLITSIHHRVDDITLEQWSVFCDASGCKVGCGASCGYHKTKAEAIEAWNRRSGADK